jgi:hypothetical protein
MSELLYNDSELQMNSQLILCIEENEDKNDKIITDTRMFIGWDNDHKNYFVRGKREDTKTSSCVPYGFKCDSKESLNDFVKFILGDSNINIILYNFNNINEMDYTDLTYEFFENNMDRNYEITGYDNVKLRHKQFQTLLLLLKNMYN